MSGKFYVIPVLLLACAFRAAATPSPDVKRGDFFVESEPGISLFVREVLPGTHHGNNTPLLLVHGARVPGVASFDLRVPNGSLAADIARAGYPVYIMDVRGYGYSTRPAAMSRPRGENPPLVRSPTAVKDIAAVVDWIRKRRSVDQVALLGWATGGNWCGYYATLYPNRVRDLILLNTLYGRSDRHPRIGHGSSLEDPEHPGQFNFARFGAYRFNTAESLFGSWDRSIPFKDKSKWRDPKVAAAYAAAALASDSTSQDRSPPSFRAPTGALEDSFYVATGHQLWDASFIYSRVLIIVSENDFWSRPVDRKTLVRDLVHAAEVKTVVIPDATHYVFLDRPEHGRRYFLDTVLSFMAGDKVPSRH